ncbi:peptidase S58 family protein [Candidatus Poribacteria bacterium]|nr:peptidase S58 family protein [Candidatus Poribacteria bacterium]
MYNAITDVPGIKVGHATNRVALTGCSVVLCEDGAVAGVDVRGSAPGTRETDALNPINTISKIHGVMLTGGSAFGLDAAGGVMKYLEELGYGYAMVDLRIPIVPAAVIFDLMVGDSSVRPDKEMGYLACLNAKIGHVEEGNVGAGTGATVGKALGMNKCMKSGIGTASINLGDIVIGAIMVVNALGDVIDPDSGKIVAGAYDRKTNQFVNIVQRMMKLKSKVESGNTTIGVIATNARLNKPQATKISQMAHDGLARAIRPVHTMADGDTIFALSTDDVRADINVIGTAAAEVTVMAILNAVKKSEGFADIPGYVNIN